MWLPTDPLSHTGLSVAAVFALDYLIRHIFGRISRPGNPVSLASTTNPTSGVNRWKIDYRLVIIGALLPDLLDRPLDWWLLPEIFNFIFRLRIKLWSLEIPERLILRSSLRSKPSAIFAAAIPERSNFSRLSRNSRLLTSESSFPLRFNSSMFISLRLYANLGMLDHEFVMISVIRVYKCSMCPEKLQASAFYNSWLCK